jgi:hypothetical protein
MVPMTEPFPIATLVCAMCRFFEKPPPNDHEGKSANRENRKFVESKVESETDSDEGK